MSETNFSLRPIINASGKMTALGASAVSAEVAAAIAGASSKYVVIEELLEEASKVIARYTGAEAGCVTCGAAAGIVISVAASITKDNLSLIESIPFVPDEVPQEIVMMRGHNINFGAPIGQMVALGGGKLIEVGQSNSVSGQHLEQAITARTAAVLYVKSHHAVQKGMLSYTEVIKTAHQKGVPVIIDAAAEEDLGAYISAGADLVIYSGGKAIEGPTSGLICGKRDLIKSCLGQYRGVGRAMKIGKENIIGLLTALQRYANLDHRDVKSKLHQRVDQLLQELSGIDYIQVAKMEDEAGRGIPRVEVKFSNPGLAEKVVRRLEAGTPALFTRNHYLNLGIIYIDPRPLQDEECALIPSVLKAAVEEVKNGE